MLKESISPPRIITISGEVSTGKSTLSRALAKSLPHWQIVNTGQMFRDFLQSRGEDILKVSALPDTVHIEFDLVQKDILASHHHSIVEGRLAGWLAQSYSDVFKIFCIADLDVRIKRYMQREGCDAQTAHTQIKYRDQKDVEKYQQVYQLSDYRDAQYYDLMLDCSTKTPEELTTLVLKHANLTH
ncbi:MAG: cytidylate kinase [Patescibacteria group bacterium]|nr:MAG: cytidylate kinase [Patescibacteria group bacterium]